MGSGSGCIPDLSSSRSEPGDDDDCASSKPPYVLDVLDKLAAEYFGHNWDRVDEMIQVNQRRLEAWKGKRERSEENDAPAQTRC